MQALDKAGGVDYLVRQANENPGPFLALVGKTLPLTMTGNGNMHVEILAVAVTTLHQKLEKLGELHGEKDSELSSGRNARQIASGSWDSGGAEDTGQTINGGYKVVQ